MGYYFKAAYRPGDDSSDIKHKLTQLFDKLGLSDTFEIVDDVDSQLTEQTDVTQLLKWLEQQTGDPPDDHTL